MTELPRRRGRIHQRHERGQRVDRGKLYLTQGAYGGYGGNTTGGGAAGAGGTGSSVLDVFDKGASALNVTANVSANGGAGSATAQAVGGASAIAAGAAVASSSVSDATSGLAQATARTSDGAGDEAIAQAAAPVGGPASAAAKANIGKGETPSVTLGAGLAESVAALTPGALTFGAGAMSARYGGEGESLSYTDSPDFYFATAAAGTLYVDLISSASSGVGFDNLELDVEVNGENHTYSFTNLASAIADLRAGDATLESVVSAGSATRPRPPSRRRRRSPLRVVAWRVSSSVRPRRPSSPAHRAMMRRFRASFSRGFPSRSRNLRPGLNG
jgi:hypothetical protein